MKKVCSAIAFFALGGVVAAEEFTGRVISVHDGDTLRVERDDGEVVRVRFEYSDAPEIDQPGGIESRDFVRAMCLNKEVTVKTDEVDVHGRALAEILVDGESVNVATIREGHAWWFYHYHADKPELGELEVQAKADQKGLFAQRAPIYPRAWRDGARPRGSSGGDSQPANGDAPPDGPGSSGGNPRSSDTPIFIMAALPDPVGIDANHETVVLANSTSVEVSVDNWRLEDASAGVFTLSGTIPAGGTRTIRLNESLKLDNRGDAITLRDSSGTSLQTLRYEVASRGAFVLAN